MRLVFKTKYRICRTDDDLYVCQFKTWYTFGWANCYRMGKYNLTLKKAQEQLKRFKAPDFSIAWESE